jgi:hypothetical protein
MKSFIKNFVDWFYVKPKLDTQKYEPPFVKEGEMWWFHCGENIGAEISGKNEHFTRPGLIYKKFSQYSFFIIPLSSREKKGSWFSPFIFNKIQQIACLHQARNIDFRRLKTYEGEVTQKVFTKIKNDFENLYTEK